MKSLLRDIIVVACIYETITQASWFRPLSGRFMDYRPCEHNVTHEKGVCMFAQYCRLASGSHLTFCMEGFIYMSCCKLPPGVTGVKGVFSIITNDIEQSVPNGEKNLTSSTEKIVATSSVMENLPNTTYFNNVTEKMPETSHITSGDHPLSMTQFASSSGATTWHLSDTESTSDMSSLTSSQPDILNTSTETEDFVFTESVSESSTATESVPESSTATGAVPESSTATGAVPESSTATGAVPESSTATGAVPESSSDQDETHKPTSMSTLSSNVELSSSPSTAEIKSDATLTTLTETVSPSSTQETDTTIEFTTSTKQHADEQTHKFTSNEYLQTETETLSPTTTSLPTSNETSNFRTVCGRPYKVPSGRIVGGESSNFGEWPWVISLRQWKKNKFLHKCGAALLNEFWAITAAHCVENVAPPHLLLRIGEYNINSDDEPLGHVERRVQLVAPYPKFDRATFEYDLALLRFYEPVKFQRNILPICIPSEDEDYVGRSAIIAGWGRLYEDGPLPETLHDVKVPVITNRKCMDMYRKAGYIEDIPDIFICAGLPEGELDSCEGDSGGPMVIQEGNGRWILAGIISWGIGCALPNQPGVYTRITKFSDWINQIIIF